MKKEILTPKTANSFKKICKLESDGFSTRNSWIALEERHVYIYNQKNGHSATGKVILTKKEFERLIKFYETGK